MAVSEVSICNNALARVSVERVASLTEPGEKAKKCNDFYAHARDALLKAHNWNFAKGRASLAVLSSTPDFEYTNEFQLPNDCLHVRTLFNYTGRWEVEGRKILCNTDESLQIKYTQKITAASRFDALFVEAFELKLAAMFAIAFKSSVSLKDRYDKEFTAAIDQAISMNAIEDDVQGREADQAAEESTWQTAGR